MAVEVLGDLGVQLPDTAPDRDDLGGELAGELGHPGLAGHDGSLSLGGGDRFPTSASA
ncbi:hypothetical protein ACWEV3_37230 [Saccharopolyspora sp. NPDC003752]